MMSVLCFLDEFGVVAEGLVDEVDFLLVVVLE